MKPWHDILVVLLAITPLVLVVLLLTVKYRGDNLKLNHRNVKVVAGKYAGIQGKIVDFPSPTNGFHTWVVLNVPANPVEIQQQYGAGWGDRIGELLEAESKGMGPRTWIKVRMKDCELLPEKEPHHASPIETP